MTRETVERHKRTGAAKAVTPQADDLMERAKARAPSVKQQLDNLKPTEILDREGNRHPLPAPASATEVAAEDAFDQHLDELTADNITFPGKLFTIHGVEGTYDVIGEDTKIEIDREVVGLPDGTLWGHARIVEGEPAKFAFGCLSNAGSLRHRDTLGDDNESAWPISKLTGKGEDPWKEQFIIPLMTRDAGAELLAFVARSATARRAMRTLLSTYKAHPRRKMGLKPVYRLGVTTFKSKYGSTLAKPNWPIIDWVNLDGTSITPLQLKAEFNDDVPY